MDLSPFRLPLLRLPSGVLKTQGPNHSFAGTGLSGLSLSPLTGGGQPVDLEGLEGRVTLVNYWGTWCPPCREEMPELVRLGKLLNDQPRFVMLLVSCGDSDVRVLKRDTEDYLKNQGWPALATYHDADYANRALLTQDTGVEVSYPTTIVLDGDGTIRGYWVGYAPGAVDQMQELVEELLEAFQ